MSLPMGAYNDIIEALISIMKRLSKIEERLEAIEREISNIKSTLQSKEVKG